MKFKIIFGIILPVLIILSITILGSLGPGFDVKENFDSTIAAKEVFKQNYGSTAIRIGEIKITNDYFLPKRYEAGSFLVCAYDKENTRPIKMIGALFYNEGEFSENLRSADISSLQYSSMPYGYYNGYRNYKTSIELDPKESKTLQVYLSSNDYYYDYNTKNSNRDYDQLLVVRQTQNAKLSCESLSSENIASALKIDIIQPLNYCFDSNLNMYSNDDYYGIRNKITIVDTCTDENNITYMDYCLDDNIVVEFDCSPKGDGEACASFNYDCRQYGYNSCSNGACSTIIYQNEA